MDQQSLDDQEPNHSSANYANFENAQKQRNPLWRRLGMFLIGLILLAGIASGVYLVFFKTKPAEQNNQGAQVSSNIAIETKNYTSDNFNLNFNYPQDWTVSDNGDGVLTVTSPSMSLKDISSQNFTGQVVMNIRDKDQKLPEFDSGNAVAAIESKKIIYIQPSDNQRGSTYISFLRYAASASGGLDGIYVTGDSGYKLNQAIPKADFTPVDPIISISFMKCNDNACANGSLATSISPSSWSDSGFSTPLKNILKSLQIN